MRSILIAFLVACAATARAAPPLPAFTVQELGPGIYAFVYPETNGAIVSGNTLVVIGDDGVLVVDAGHFPTRATEIVAQIRRWTKQPVRYLVNTHWHPDHDAGNGVFARAFPGLAIVATEATRHDIIEVLPKKELSKPQIDGILAAQASGKGPDGKPLDAGTRRYYDKIAPELRAFLPELARAEHTTPTVTFSERMTVYLGKREVQLKFLGRGNTAGDAIVYVPDAKLVATGDLLVHPVPYPFGSFIGEWIATLRELRKLPAQTIVPGHGPVMHDAAFLDLTIDVLAAVKSQVDAAVAKGRSLEETQKQVRVDALRAKLVGSDPDRAFFFDHGFLETAIRRAYREAKTGPLQDQD